MGERHEAIPPGFLRRIARSAGCILPGLGPVHLSVSGGATLPRMADAVESLFEPVAPGESCRQLLRTRGAGVPAPAGPRRYLQFAPEPGEPAAAAAGDHGGGIQR